MAFPSGWTHYKEFTVTGSAPAGYPVELRVWKNEGPIESWAFVERSSANVDAYQDVATDGTYFYTTETDDGTGTKTLKKWSKSGNVYTQVAEHDTSSDGSGSHTQINGVIYDSATGLLYVSAMNFVVDWSGTPAKASWVYRYDPSDLSFVDYETLDGNWSEGHHKWDGYWWVVYHDLHEIHKYTETNAAEGSLAWSQTATYSLPDTSQEWQGIFVRDGIFYLNAHDPAERIHAYEWTGSGFKRIDYFTPYSSGTTQGMCDDGTHIYFAERNYATNDHRIVKMLPSHIGESELSCEGLCEDDFSDIRITDSTGATVYCGDGAGWREHYESGKFAWFHFALPNAISTSETFRCYFGQSSPGAWSDSRASIVDLVEDFESGVGIFDTTYQTATTSAVTTNPLQGSQHLNLSASAGGVHTDDDEFFDEDEKRLTVWMARRVSESSRINCFIQPSVGGGQKQTAFDYDGTDLKQYVSGTTTKFADDKTYGANDYIKVTFAVDYSAGTSKLRAWMGNGGLRMLPASPANVAMASVTKTYYDVLFYRSQYADLVYSRPLVLPEPVVGGYGSLEEAAGGGAAYDETFAASATSAVTLTDAWSLNYSETYSTSAAASLALSDSYATGYAETYTASAAAALTLTDAWLLDFAETYGANASGDLALTDGWSLDYSETYAVGTAADLALADAWALDYAETLTVTATGDLALSNAYAVGNNYDESFSVAAVADLSLTDVWAPHYGETLAADATAALALTDTWQLDYAETLAASAAAELLLSDAYDSPAPGAYDETFTASAIAALDLTHLFTTPNALPAGINHLTAMRVGGFFAVKP